MAGKGFATDNLVTMRDKLKKYQQPAEARPEPTEQEEAPAASPPPPAAAPASVTTSQSLPTIPRASANRNDETERTRRELEGRLHRDLNRLQCELETERIRLAEFERFQQTLATIHRELEAVIAAGPEDPLYAQKLDRLRLTYYQAAGRARAFESQAAPIHHADPHATHNRSMKEALPVAIAILLGSAIVAGTLALLFA